MSIRPRRDDDALFLSALAAVLAGTGLLLRTTGILRFADYLWPLIVMTAGGILFYLAIVRKLSELLYAGGVFFVAAGFVFLLAALLDLSIGVIWPLFMCAAGFAWFAYGYRRRARILASFSVPALGFVLLGGFFALFSFDAIPMSLGRFILRWWPTVLIGGGIALFSVYGAKNRRKRSRGRHPAS